MVSAQRQVLDQWISQDLSSTRRKQRYFFLYWESTFRKKPKGLNTTCKVQGGSDVSGGILKRHVYLDVSLFASYGSCQPETQIFSDLLTVLTL